MIEGGLTGLKRTSAIDAEASEAMKGELGQGV